MPKSRLLLSASGVLIGALLVGASPAFAQMPVFDGVNYALQGVIKAIEQTMSNTLNSITNQLTATGPLGTILGDVKNGSITTLLMQGFTQNANYAKAQVDAVSQITDGALTSHARFERDMRNAQIRDEHTTSSLHCTALDAGQDGHRQRRVILESRAIYFGRRRQSRRGGAEPAGFLRPVAGGRSHRATAFCPLLLAGRGDRRPLLVVLDTQRRPARLDPVRNRHAQRTDRRQRRQRFRHQPDRTDRARRRCAATS